MPTTTEVEARLRRTAAACEPIVDEMAEMAVPSPTVDLGRGPAGPRRTGWLVAAALVVVAAVGATIAVARDEPVSDEVRAAPSTTLFDLTPTTDPRAANPTVATPVTLPDGTALVVSIPGPLRWSVASFEVAVALDGVADPVAVTLSRLDRAASQPVVEQQLSDRASLVTWGDRQYLVVDVDGWIASLHLASDGGDLPDERAAAVGEDLTFRVTAEGPVDVGGPGLTATQASATLLPEDDAFGMESSLTITRVGDDEPWCSPVTSRVMPPDQRCLADDRLRVSARGSTATAVLPGIDAAFAGEAPATGLQVPVSLADGTAVVLTIPTGGAWVADAAVAWVDVNGVESGIGPLHVMLFPETALQTAARHGSTLEVLDDGLYLATDPSGNVALMVEGGGWNASLPLSNPAQPVPDDVRARLERTLDLEASDAGPSGLDAIGLEVVETMTIVSATDPPVDRTTGAIDAFHVTRYQEDDGEVRVEPVGPRAEAARGDLTFEASPPR